MNDCVDDLQEDQEYEDEFYTQIMDEVGLTKLSNTVQTAPSPPSAAVSPSVAEPVARVAVGATVAPSPPSSSTEEVDPRDWELEERLKRLK